MNTAALIALYLIAQEPFSLDAAARRDRLEAGRPIWADASQSAVMRARSAGPSIAARVLACYHPSATLLHATDTGHWRQAWEAGADHSAVMDIAYRGLSGSRYDMRVAIAARVDGVTVADAKSRAFVLADNAILPRKPDCALNEWHQPEI
jgi:hypothetical protein